MKLKDITMKILSLLSLGALTLSLTACPPPTGGSITSGPKAPDKRPDAEKYPDPGTTKDPNEGTDNAGVKIIYPEVLISIPEYHISRTTRVTSPAAETQFITSFNNQHFKVLDKKQAEKAWKDDVLYKLEKEEDITAAASLAFKSGADILVIGEAFSEKGATTSTSTGGINTNIYTSAARVDIKVIKASNGQILLADSETAKGADTADNIAGKKAIDAAALKLSQRISTQLVSIWNDPRNRTIEIIVSAPNKGFTLKEAEKFRKALVKDVTGVTEVVLREFTEGAAPMEVSYSGDAQGLSSAVDGKTIGGRKCSVPKMQEGKIFINVQ
jgi:hypothetical protein